eukprot:Nitzschia sp. Nitz4//scaffold15_size197535//3819//4694//NITZ4_001544-RA/size197535-snap-gene-0.38-mRNA-1//1//CDS//3329537613//8936//frame0
MFPLRIATLLVWAGPHRTADDVVVQANRAFLRHIHGNVDTSTQAPNDSGHLIVVTSDHDLKQRCLLATSSTNARVKQGRQKRKKGKVKDWGVRVASSVDFWTSCLGGSSQDHMQESKKDAVKATDHQETFQNEIPGWDMLCNLEEELRSFGALHNHSVAQTSTASPTLEQTWQRVVSAEAMRQSQKNNSPSTIMTRDDNNNNNGGVTASFLQEFHSYFKNQQQSPSKALVTDQSTEYTRTERTETNLLADHRICALGNQKERLLQYLHSSSHSPLLATNSH